MEEYQYQKQIGEANEIISQLKERCRKSLAKGKELSQQLNEIQDIIDQLSEESGYEESKEVVSELMEKKKKLTKEVTHLKKGT